MEWAARVDNLWERSLENRQNLIPRKRRQGARLRPSIEDEFRGIWDGLELRNDRIRAATPIEFRPFDDSLRDCVESLLAVAGVVPNRRP